MKIKIKNLGGIKQAEFDIGDLTIICGRNNTGKTYATHATFAFLDYLRTNAEFPVPANEIDLLFAQGTIKIPLQPYINDLNKYLKT